MRPEDELSMDMLIQKAGSKFYLLISENPDIIVVRSLSEAKDTASETFEEISQLKAKSRVLDTFLRFKESEKISNRELMGKMSPSRLQYRTKVLYEMGLISREGSPKEPIWAITKRGKQVLSRF